MSHGPIDPKYLEMMNKLATVLDDVFNGPNCPPEKKTVAFALLVFPAGESEDRRSNYISNAGRADMLCAMKEFIARNEGCYVETAVKQ